VQIVKICAVFNRGYTAMGIMTISNIPDDVRRALRMQAAKHARITEVEVRDILANAVKPAARIRMGEALAALSQKIGLTNDDFDVFDQVTDKVPAVPTAFE